MPKLGVFLKNLPLMSVVILMFAVPASAEQPPSVLRQKVAMATLTEIPGYSLTSVTVELEPETTIGPHTHSGFVFAYVLEGTIRSQLNDDIAIDYHVGDSWVEPSGTLHRLTQNPSQTQNAKILAVFVAETDSALTFPAQELK